MTASRRQVVLVIFDGWGYREEFEGNAIAAARTPCFDELWRDAPHALLSASGEAVGLPPGQMGNSEVGHLTIGAGRVVDTDVVRITKAFESGAAEGNQALQTLFAHVRTYGSTLHIQGLLSPGGIHSHHHHLYELLRLVKREGIEDVAVHVFTDGRDTPPQSAERYVRELEATMKEIGVGRIATISGRYYAMDRDHNWDRVLKVEEALFEGRGEVLRTGSAEALSERYANGAWDEHFLPMVFPGPDGEPARIDENDGVLFFNFRPDRARMLSRKVSERVRSMNLCFVTMTEYDKDLEALVAFPKVKVPTTLAAEVSRAGLSQAHIAETEKYAHVTYFLNGGEERPHPGEEFILVDSRKDVRTHDEAPDMRAAEITDKAIACLERGTDLVVLNYANPDMVGHTANFDATVRAVEAVDRNLARLTEKARERGGAMVVTADHGNAEMVTDPATGVPHTAHTANPVPVIVVGIPGALREGGGLSDIAPTVLSLLGVPVPGTMTGKTFVERQGDGDPRQEP